MNREIKFRGKRVDNGEWVYGHYAHGDIHTKPSFVDGANTEWWGYEVDPSTVGQFTGLKDKDGKDVYDGDMLEDQGKSIGVVEWNQDDCSFSINWISSGLNLYESMYQDDVKHFRKIGDIHDNPELLKS